MGWWKVEGTETVIGDRPLDILSVAAAEVVSEYRLRFDRRPTRAEWEALIFSVLGAEEPEVRVSDDGIATKVTIEMRVAPVDD
jgi:hypothetical protein